MATTAQVLIDQIRIRLRETTASFWTDAELLAILNKGVKDLWRAVVDLDQDFFQTVDTSNVTQATDATTLTGVPASVYKIILIEPSDTTPSGSNRGLIYRPAKYNAPVFQGARSLDSVDPLHEIIWYAMSQAGGPIAAPTVHVAPTVTSTVNLRFVYVPIQADLALSDNNPIPGESDNALIAWTCAIARAKEREEATPDPEWIAIYATEKQNILTSLTPRQVQEPEVAEAMYEGWEY